MFPLYDLNPHRRFPLLTVVIIAINVAVMAWMTKSACLACPSLKVTVVSAPPV